MSAQMLSVTSHERRAQIRRSALWAAYGDALGFITEMADEKLVRRRVGRRSVETTAPWRRRVGGQFGPTLELPAGCLSDDTQLRLATSRSIRGDGAFDAETFSKVELTVWLSYALGAGRGSKAAAASLRSRQATWATNFFADERTDYLSAGGNGAAMRIQPHVWSAGGGAGRAALSARIVQNAVITHGHARGILGAVFHARCLEYALEKEAVPGPGTWRRLIEELTDIADLVREDAALSELWLGQWELRRGESFGDATAAVVRELKDDLDRCGELDGGDAGQVYSAAATALGALHPEARGSGTKTALLAALAAWLFPDPEEAMRTCANLLGSDTDSIATMAGALLGAVTDGEPQGEICDRAYVLLEADRMWAISQGTSPPVFPYPDVVGWSPPQSGSDGVARLERGLHVAGLGPAVSASETHTTGGKTPGVWQWLELWYGQRVLAKSRPRPKSVSSSQRVEATEEYVAVSLLEKGGGAVNGSGLRRSQLSLPAEELESRSANRSERHSLHELTKRVIASDFDPAIVGRALLELADHEDGIEASIAYASIVAKARMTRRERERGSHGEQGRAQG